MPGTKTANSNHLRKLIAASFMDFGLPLQFKRWLLVCVLVVSCVAPARKADARASLVPSGKTRRVYRTQPSACGTTQVSLSLQWTDKSINSRTDKAISAHHPCILPCTCHLHVFLLRQNQTAERRLQRETGRTLYKTIIKWQKKSTWFDFRYFRQSALYVSVFFAFLSGWPHLQPPVEFILHGQVR